jgi:hypothetical protein
MENIVKLLANPELAFASQVEIINLINSLILKNRSLYDRLPWEVQKYLGANIYGAKLIKLPGKAEIVERTILGQTNPTHTVKELLQLLQSLVDINTSLKNHLKAVEEDKQKKEQDNLNLIASAIAGPVAPVAPTGPVFIELKKSKGDYNAEINGLVGQQLKNVYALLVEAIDHVYKNQSFFKTGAILSVSSKEEITYTHIQDAIKNNEMTMKLIDPPLYEAKKNLLLYTKILYLMIIYHFYKTAEDIKVTIRSAVKKVKITLTDQLKNINNYLREFSNKPTASIFNNVINDLITTNGILNIINKLKIIKGTTPLDLSKSTDLFITKDIYKPDITYIITGFTKAPANNLLNLAGGGIDKYYAKYLKYKAKYQQLKAQLKAQELI